MAVQLAHVDEAAPYRTQLAARTGPIVLVNTFSAPEGKMDEVLAAWKLDSEYFKSKPGSISAQLHRGQQRPGEHRRVGVHAAARGGVRCS